MRRLLSVFMVTLIGLTPLFAAENGENVFNKTFDMIVGTNDHALWEVDHLPDLDNDGMDEILACSDEGGITLFLFESNGDDSYEVKWEYTITDVVYSYTISHGDLDYDGVPEIVVGANAGAGQDAIWIFEWDEVEGSDNYTLQASWSVIPGGGAGITALEVMDLDGDGVDEMFIGETAFDDFYVVQLDTNTTFSFPNWNVEMLDSLDNTGDYSPWGFTAGDFDGDGMLEFASVEWDYNGLAVFQADGADTYSREFWINDMTPQDGSTLRSLSSADLDGDGYIEIILPSTNGRLYIFTNDGDMSAIDNTNYQDYLYRVFTGENNGWSGGAFGDADMFYGSIGEPDIYVAQDILGNSKILNFEYNGGAIGDSTSYDYYEIAVNTTDSSQVYQDITTGDFDNDGQTEIVTVATDGNSVEIFEHEDLTMANASNTVISRDSSEYIYQIRGVHAGSDLDGDGNAEVFVTDYRNTSKVHVFEVIGDNTMEWVFTTDTTGSSAYAATRNVATGDLDGDGLGEFMFTVNGAGGVDGDVAGLVVYESDGTNDGYYKAATIAIDDTIDAHPDRWSLGEQFDVYDLDGDGKDEVMLANNGSDGNIDRCYILSIDGTFETLFSVVTEGVWNKTDHAFGGSPYGATYGDTDGDGMMEAIFNIWDYGSVFIVEATGENTYEYQNYLSLDYTGDGVFLDGITVTDIDGDGKDEIYAPIYGGAELAVVDAGDDISAATVESNVGYVRTTYGAGWGGIDAADYNNDGTPELYNAQYVDYVYQFSFTGGDAKDGANYDLAYVEKNMEDAQYGSFAVSTPGDLDGDGKGEVYIGHLEVVNAVNMLTVVETGTGVFVEEEWDIVTPNDYKLAQNYPNPFNPTTQIDFTLPLEKDVKVVVYDLMGHRVKTLVNKTMTKGDHSVMWDGTNEVGQQVASGVYIYRLEAGNVVKSKKMTLIR